MPVPDFQTIMLPLLESVRDGNEYSISELADLLADRFELTPAERNERVPSGVTRFRDRVHWANTYMKKAILLESPGRGRIRITPRGLELLQENPQRIDRKLLMRYPEYVEFASPGDDNHSNDTDVQDDKSVDRTPHETMELAYREMKESLAQDLLARVKTCSPGFFENLVLDVLVAMGYGGSRDDAAQSVGQTGDGGIDGIIKQDRLGLDVLYVQAKRWENTVGRPVVQAFAGSLDGVKARKGVLITTSRFSKDATEYVDKIEKRIILVDGQQLAELMIAHEVGVSRVMSYDVKRVDQDYFED